MNTLQILELAPRSRMRHSPLWLWSSAGCSRFILSRDSSCQSTPSKSGLATWDSGRYFWGRDNNCFGKMHFFPELSSSDQWLSIRGWWVLFDLWCLLSGAARATWPPPRWGGASCTTWRSTPAWPPPSSPSRPCSPAPCSSPAPSSRSRRTRCTSGRTSGEWGRVSGHRGNMSAITSGPAPATCTAAAAWPRVWPRGPSSSPGPCYVKSDQTRSLQSNMACYYEVTIDKKIVLLCFLIIPPKFIYSVQKLEWNQSCDTKWQKQGN